MDPDIYVKRTVLPARVEDVFAWHERAGAIERLTPPWAPMELISRTGPGVTRGVRATFRLRVFGIPVIWEAEHVGYVPNREFRDRQVRGPFFFWEHTHRFIPTDGGKTVMEDRVAFKLPFGLLSRPFYGLAKKEFERMFAYRHRVLQYDLEKRSSHDRPSLRILVSGSGGAIGTQLVPFLRTRGHEVIRLVRRKRQVGTDAVFWDPYKGILDLESVGPIDAVINLNGLDISRGRWTPALKKKIVDSRFIPTRLLARRISELEHKPRVLVSASAIGFYGDAGDTTLTESSPSGRCFISHVCRQWEKAAYESASAGIRTVLLRIGIVLTPAGGALSRMAPAFKAGCGVVLAHGRQYMSWISMDDLLAAVLHIIQSDKIHGPVNLTAPQPVPNREFSTLLARVLSRPLIFRMPGFLVRWIWGQMGRETLLTSARVKPQKLVDSGFVFRHETLLSALKHLLGR